MAFGGQCLLSKQEDMSLDPACTYKLGTKVLACTPTVARQRQADLQSLSSDSLRDTVFKNKVQRYREGHLTSTGLHLGTHRHVHIYLKIHIQYISTQNI